MIWARGATHVTGGWPLARSLLGFVSLLHERAQIVASKREGYVVEPTTNRDGQRTNASTLAMHALFLDCDGTGSWNSLLTALRDLNFAFVAYQSGGWTPHAEKWRIVLPLAQPFDVSDEKKREQWKVFYNHARVLFGSVAELRGVGFDPATDTPCCPWFLTERRNPDDLPRQVVSHLAGHRLDAMSMCIALPAMPEAEERPRTPHQLPTSTELSPARTEEIISALATATNDISSNRRDLYLTLPAVLRDKGLTRADVRSICETVSELYPRLHPEKHADNVHCIETTLNKWESDGKVTRIGTLNAVLPAVAKVVDALFPSAFAEAIYGSGKVPAPGAPPAPVQEKGSDVYAALRKLIRKKQLSDSAKAKFIAQLIESFLVGMPLLSDGDIAAVDDADHRKFLMKYAGYEGLKEVAKHLGNNLNFSWDSILQCRMRRSLQKDFVVYPKETLEQMRIIFDGEKARRAAWDAERKAQREKEAQERFIATKKYLGSL
jgi:hypothetical protein